MYRAPLALLLSIGLVTAHAGPVLASDIVHAGPYASPPAGEQGPATARLGRIDDAEAAARSEDEWLAHVVGPVHSENWREVKSWSSKWVEYRPNSARGWYFLGFAKLHLKQYAEALDSLRVVVRFEPKIAMAWVGIGKASANLGRYEEAREAFKEAVEAAHALVLLHGKTMGHKVVVGETIKDRRVRRPERPFRTAAVQTD